MIVLLLWIFAAFVVYFAASPVFRFQGYLFSNKRKSVKVSRMQAFDLLLLGNQPQLWETEEPLGSTKELHTKWSTTQPTRPSIDTDVGSPSQIKILNKTSLTPSRFPVVMMRLNRTDLELANALRLAVETGVPTQGLQVLSKARLELERAGRMCVRPTVAYDTKNLNKENYPIFIHIPKAGGTSIENIAFSVFPPGDRTHVQWGRTTKKQTLYKTGISKDDLELTRMKNVMSGSIHPYYACHWWHRPIDWWRSQGSKYFSHRRTFCIVRNPWTKIVSELNFVSHKKPPNCIKTDHAERHLRAFMRRQRENITFHKRQIPMPISDCHFIPQVEYVFDDHGCRVCDDVVYIEDLVRQLTVLFTAYGFEPPFIFEHANGMNTCDEIKMCDMDGEIKSSITAYYEKDFLTFGYSKDPGEI